MPRRPVSGKFRIIFALFLGFGAMAGCDDGPVETRTPVVLDARLSAIYERSCMACHTVPDSGAPQTHSTTAWTPRLKQDDAVLFAHMVDGFGGMPPLGQCMECSGEDLMTLMNFMAAPAASKTTHDNKKEKEEGPAE